jgi:hypothetical protein
MALLHKESIASWRGDRETCDIEGRAARDASSTDQLCRVIACAMSRFMIGTTVATVSITGFPSIALSVCLFAVANGMTESLLQRKNVYGGWGPWLLSFIVRDRREKMWSGILFEEKEPHIADALRCTISSRIV